LPSTRKSTEAVVTSFEGSPSTATPNEPLLVPRGGESGSLHTKLAFGQNPAHCPHTSWGVDDPVEGNLPYRNKLDRVLGGSNRVVE
jgi:hypothetical protein